MDEYLELFRNGVRMRVAAELLGFSVESRDGAKDVDGSNFLLARVYVWVVTVLRCSTERETQ